jgi:hypothetical protein
MLFACALLYWLTRYRKDLATATTLKFVEYAAAEWGNFLWGCVGAALLMVLYVYVAPEVLKVACSKWAVLCGVVIPPVNLPIAGLFGFAGKSFFDRLPRILAWFGARVKLPGRNGAA